LLPEVRGKLLELAQDSPHGPDGFIFFGSLADTPVDRSVLLDGLHDALASIGIDGKARGIVFHSWRHYYAARMADRMTADQMKTLRKSAGWGPRCSQTSCNSGRGRNAEAPELPRREAK
jgi:integrase